MKEKVDMEKAFIAIVRQYERVIYKVCSFYVSDGFPLADLYQEVVCNLWISFPAPESMEHNIREMYRLIAQLKTLEKAIILLYLEEKTYQEIADITGLTVSNVAIKLKRAKE